MNIPQSLHFIGIGGVGMSAIAQIWHAKGARVTGSDSQESSSVQRLRNLGIPVYIGHAAEHVGEAEAVVLSTAVSDSNPEVQEARLRGLPLLHRSHVLGALMREKCSVAVTGTHGKTTTTAMLASILLEADVSPTVLVGGDIPHLGGNACYGRGELLVAEADESDKSIRNLWADVVILTNLEGDHLDHYRDLDEIIEVMAAFINGLSPSARLIACVDDPGVRQLLKAITIQAVTYGFSTDADFPISKVDLSASGSTFCIGEDVFVLQVPGRHNVANATAALSAARLLNIPQEALLAGLASFMGVKRRFQTIGSVGGVTVIDDYAHHPSEIKATLQTAALLKRPIHAVFQPHRYSRLDALLEDFAHSFALVASVTILETYAAGETPRKASALGLSQLIGAYEPGVPVTHAPTLAAAVTHLGKVAEPGDLVVLLGAGDIHGIGQPLLLALEARHNLKAQTA